MFLLFVKIGINSEKYQQHENDQYNGKEFYKLLV